MPAALGVLSVRPRIAIVPRLGTGCNLTQEIQGMVAQVAEMMKERLNIRGSTLVEKLRHTGRMMPRQVKSDAALLADAVVLAQSARLHKRIDTAKVDAAYKSCVQFLESVDVADRRRGAVLGTLASAVLSLSAVAALVVAVLIWRGYI